MRHALRSFEIQPEWHDLLCAAGRGEAHPQVPQTWILCLVAAATTRTFGRVNANLGWTDIEFGADARAGDTLQVRSKVLEVRESRSRTDEGIVTVATSAANQIGEQVLGFQRTLLVYRSSRAAHYAAARY
jgi:itaconyl-CoA hydratase